MPCPSTRWCWAQRACLWLGSFSFWLSKDGQFVRSASLGHLPLPSFASFSSREFPILLANHSVDVQHEIVPRRNARFWYWNDLYFWLINPALNSQCLEKQKSSFYTTLMRRLLFISFLFHNYRYPFIHILGGESDTFSFDDTTTRSFLDIVDSLRQEEAGV